MSVGIDNTISGTNSFFCCAKLISASARRAHVSAPVRSNSTRIREAGKATLLASISSRKVPPTLTASTEA
ncbi:hypothetical protein HMPREF2757_09355 [Brevibacterium sp. HMSC063G07]|nr:hypothetical protein HMPREF2757_09355 [Brevibacterium sp. HMSC063G07]